MRKGRLKKKKKKAAPRARLFSLSDTATAPTHELHHYLLHSPTAPTDRHRAATAMVVSFMVCEGGKSVLKEKRERGCVCRLEKREAPIDRVG